MLVSILYYENLGDILNSTPSMHSSKHSLHSNHWVIEGTKSSLAVKKTNRWEKEIETSIFRGWVVGWVNPIILFNSTQTAYLDWFKLGQKISTRLLVVRVTGCKISNSINPTWTSAFSVRVSDLSCLLFVHSHSLSAFPIFNLGLNPLVRLQSQTKHKSQQRRQQKEKKQKQIDEITSA